MLLTTLLVSATITPSFSEGFEEGYDAKSTLESIAIEEIVVEHASVQEVINLVLEQCQEIMTSRGESSGFIDSLFVPAPDEFLPSFQGSVTGEFGPASAWDVLEFHGSMCGFEVYQRTDGRLEFRTEPKRAANRVGTGFEPAPPTPPGMRVRTGRFPSVMDSPSDPSRGRRDTEC